MGRVTRLFFRKKMNSLAYEKFVVLFYLTILNMMFSLIEEKSPKIDWNKQRPRLVARVKL